MAQHKMLINLHIAKTGEEGLQFLSRAGRFEGLPRPDLILLDLNLPGMDGREVLKEIKSNEGYRQIPVVVLTTSEADLDVLKAYAMGANAYVVKPVDFETFSKIIAQIEDFWFSVVKLPTHQLVEKYSTPIGTAIPLSVQQQETSGLVGVLHVEDSDADADLVSEALSQLAEPRFSVHREVRLVDGFQYLVTHVVDAVLLDLSLPDSQGFESVARFLEKFPKLPVIVLTGSDNKALGARSVREGAQDYLYKGHIDSEILGRVIVHAIERKISSTAQTAAFEREHLALNEAQKAIGTRDEFFSIASHELRTPLTALKLQVHLLAKELERPESKEPDKSIVMRLASQAEGQIERFSHLVETLLDFSRIQSGRMKLELSNFDLGEMIKETIEQLSPELKAVGSSVTLNVGQPVSGNWDRLRLEQVVFNLISNAMKYARGKPIAVSVSSDGESALIQVKDQGPGIARADKERIFHKFERAPGLRSISGLGLGLYVVRQIVDMHCGSVYVESELGAGATFIVRIPLKLGRAMPLEEQKAVGA
jgi:signal transduction histidine kinase